MAEHKSQIVPSIEEQRQIYQVTNGGIMNWLETQGTLTIAKKKFARWLFVAETLRDNIAERPLKGTTIVLGAAGVVPIHNVLS